MGGLAQLARAAGHRVSGCDANVYPPMSDQLADAGITLIEGYAADQLAVGAETFVIQGEPERRDLDRLVWTLDLRSI